MMKFELKSKVEIYSKQNIFLGHSILMDFTDRYIFVTKPIKNGIQINLEIGSTINLIYYSKNKIYGFDLTVLEEVVDNIVLYRLPFPVEFYVVQRRQYVRIPIVIDIKYLKYNDYQTLDLENFNFQDLDEKYENIISESLSFDLSGIGIGIVTDEHFEINDKLIIYIENPDLNLMTLGQVKRIDQIENRRSFRLGIEFINIVFKDKEKVINYVFKMMRNQLKYK